MDYKTKYLKYKNKYLTLKNKYGMIGGSKFPPIRYFKLDKGTKLFRSAPNISRYYDIKSNLQLCSDTHKMGIYLGSNLLLSLAIMIEENNLSEIGIFELNKDINIAMGKYSYRGLNPSKYFDTTGKLKLYLDPSEEENISHRGCRIQPLKMKQSNPELIKLYSEMMSLDNSNPKKRELRTKFNRRLFLLPPNTNVDNFCEIFISKDVIVRGDEISLVKKYKVNLTSPDELLSFIETNNYPIDLDFYITNGILVEI